MPAVSMKRKRRAVVLDDFVDGVAGGARDGGDDGAVGGGEGVQERGFADVGVADDGDFGFLNSSLVAWSLVVGASFWSVRKVRNVRDACGCAGGAASANRGR